MLEALLEFIKSTGYYALFANGFDVGRVVMIAISCLLLYLAIKKGFEPLLLVPIAFGMLLTNLPLGDMMIKPVLQFLDNEHTTLPLMNHINVVSQGNVVGQIHTALQAPGGLFYYLYLGVKLGIFPPLIFMGVGAMTDFGPLIANPRSLLLGAAAQFGIFFTFIGALLLGFTGQEAGAIGIIGGADGPTAIFVASKLAPHLLGAIAVVRHVSKTEKIIFPIGVTIIVSMLVPAATALVGMLMLGNLFRECGVTARLEDTAKNALINIVTIFLGVTVGATATAESFLSPSTLKIIALGVTAFAVGTATGVLLAKLMNKLSGGTINPLIGSAGVSAVPMAARVSQVVGQKENPSNFLLMHAMGPNVAGVIGSAVAAGVLLTLFG